MTRMFSDIITDSRLNEPHVVTSTADGLMLCPLDVVLTAGERIAQGKFVSPVQGLTLAAEGFVAECLPQLKRGDVMFFTAPGDKRIVAHQCTITPEAKRLVAQALGFSSSNPPCSINMDTRLRLSLNRTGTTLTIQVPENYKDRLAEMRTGKRVLVQFAHPKDWDPIAPGNCDDPTLDIVFEDDTQTPWAFTCKLYDFFEYDPGTNPMTWLPSSKLGRVHIEYRKQVVLTLPARTTLTHQGNTVTSNSITVNFKPETEK